MIAHAKSPSSLSRGIFVSACAAFSLLTGPLHAGMTPKNVDNGLDALLEANLKVEQAKKNHTEGSLQMFDGYATKKAANMSQLAMKDGGNRILVRIQPNGVVPIKELQERAAAKVPRMKIQATDYAYHGAGVFEAWVPLQDVAKLCALKGVSHVSLTPKPVNNRLMQKLTERVASTHSRQVPAALQGENLNILGTVFDFGITQHRVDQINQAYNPLAPVDYEGQRMSIAAMSDSFDTSTNASTTYADDAASGDLPGSGNTFNPTPVFVLQDYPGGTDEGRAMCQTLYKMAPKASLAFATGDVGEIGFANNIRELANLPGFPNGTAFTADVICDDLSYYDEPFFQDGIIAQGVNDVVAAGVAYCSSAANNAGTNGYDADFNFIPNDPTGSGSLTAAGGNTALANTNINLANVPAYLYAGGFQNFNPSGTVAAGTTDVAQLVNYPGAATLSLYGLSALPTILQWNDPDDTTIPSISNSPIYTDTGTITYPTNSSTGVAFTHPLVAGQEYYLYLNPSASPTTPGLLPLDGQITVTDPNGNEISFTDNNGDGAPEQTIFFAPIAGTYTFTITAFELPSDDYVTDRSFTLSTSTASGTQYVTNSLNLLVFDTSGNYIAADSSGTNAIASGTPIDIVDFEAPAPADGTVTSQVQFVIAKGNVTPSPGPSGFVSNHLRYLCFGDGIGPLGPAEYFSYTTPLTFGHSCAAGAMGVAAYPYYKPNIPEYFSSPGPSTQYFDADNNYIGKQVRLKPDIAAMDGANTTFFGSDDGGDEDSSPNFFGTSDASPHAAAIAALVIQANGGPGSITPAALKAKLQATTFPHDLDPYYAKGVARTTDGGKVTVIVKGDDEDETFAGDGAQGTAGNQDPNAITIQYEGPGSLESFVLNPSGSVATAGNVTDGTNGITDTVPYSYFDMSTPGIIFSVGLKAFTPGTSVPSALAAEATATQSNFVSGSLTHSFSLAVSFTEGDFVGGDIFRFTFGRDEYQDADSPPSAGGAVNNGSADLFGGGVSIPDATINTPLGMTFGGTTSGGTFGSTSPGMTSQTAVIRNRIGHGYSPLDGFGFLDAQTAVGQPFGDAPVPEAKTQAGSPR
jgi:hypothetical protein